MGLGINCPDSRLSGHFCVIWVNCWVFSFPGWILGSQPRGSCQWRILCGHGSSSEWGEGCAVSIKKATWCCRRGIRTPLRSEGESPSLHLSFCEQELRPITIAKLWKQPKCPSMDKWIKKMWYICTYIQMHTHVYFYKCAYICIYTPTHLHACVCVYVYMCVVCPEASSHVIWKIDIYWRRYKVQETLYIGQWCLSPLQSRHLGISHRSPSHHQLHCCIFLSLTDISEISSLWKVILVLGKARSCRVPNLGCSGAESPGWFDVSQKSLHETWCMSRHIVVMKLPITSYL